MVSTKSRYRKFATGGAVDVQVDTPAAHISADNATEQMLGAKQAASVDVGDDASAAFQKQIDSLRQAEAIQRQRAAGAVPETREGRMVHWRNQGFSLDQAEYMASLLEHPEITHAAVTKARQSGLADENSQQFHDAVRAHFQLLQGVDPTDIRLDGEAPERANEFPDPAAPAPKRTRAIPDSDPLPASLMSAPVSRETMANGSYNSNGERPGQVRMTPDMKMAAKISGISEAEYAANVLRLREEKANGHHGGQP